VIGYVSYRIGRDVIGVKLAESGTPIRQLDPSTLRAGQRDTHSSTSLDDTFSSRAPLRPVIEVEPLEDTLEPEYGGIEADTMESEAASEETEEPEPETSATAETEGSPDETAVAAPPMDRRRSVPGANRFRVRVGSYTDEDTLVSQMARLRDLGYRPWVEEFERDGVVYKRLFVAEAPTYADAAKLQEGLLEQNIDSLVVEE
jgi:cell division septation protein DedD